MKKIMLILLLFAFTFPVVGQEVDSVKTFKKQKSLDINLLGLGINETKPINEKYALAYGMQGGFIYNYFITQTNQRDFAAAYLEAIGVFLGINYNHIKPLQFIGSLKIALPYNIADIANFQSPFFGTSLIIYCEISQKVSIGTNIDFGVIKLENRFIETVSTSFIFVRVKLKNNNILN